MEFPGFFAEAPSISLRDPLAQFLGASKSGMITYAYVDAVRLAGHSCPTVAGAYLMVRRGLQLPYDSEMPERLRLDPDLRHRIAAGARRSDRRAVLWPQLRAGGDRGCHSGRAGGQHRH